MMIVLALLGALWLLLLLRRWQRRARPDSPLVRGTVLALAFAALAMTLLDSAAQRDLVAVGPVPDDEAAVRFIQDRTEPCPVAQLPVNGIPNSRLAYGFLDDQLYRGVMPYLLAPDHFWSAGSHSSTQPSGLSLLPTEATAADLSALGAQGYCAVLFSRSLAAQGVAQGVDLQGRAIVGREPDYQNKRFAVYLL